MTIAGALSRARGGCFPLTAQILEGRPYWTCTAMELIKTYLEVYVAIGRLQSSVGSTTPDQVGRGKLAEVIEFIMGQCSSLDMPLVELQATVTIKAIAGGNSFIEVCQKIAELCSRFEHYLDGRSALMIPLSQRAYYDAPGSGWERVIERFPRVIDDIEEASRCLALDRNNACVYHLAGVIQEALESLGRRLGVKLDPTVDTWNGLAVKIENSMKVKQASMPKPKWKRIEPFYSEVLSDIKAIKNAWRNPTMHFRRRYTDAEAAKVYRRVQEFMVHASRHLKSRKQRGR